MKTKHRSPMQFLSIAITLLIISMSTQAQTSNALTQELAPTGTLRASINLGNPILANKDDKGQPFGVSIDLATELAKRLNVPLSLVVFETAGQSVDAVTNEKADFGFFAIDPVRG
jgi:polar amino acid transport system substrate-binding protein